MSAICATCKAVELQPLRDRSTQEMRQVFQDQVVCRYGCPLVVRSDDGPEFKKEFAEYLKLA